AVERLVVEVLAADPAAAPPGVPHAETPRASLAWAESVAETLRGAGGRADQYRGLPPISVWGIVLPRAGGSEGGCGGAGGAGQVDGSLVPGWVRTLRRWTRGRQAAAEEDDDKLGMWMVQIDDPQESVEDPMGLQRPTDRDDDAAVGDLA